MGAVVQGISYDTRFIFSHKIHILFLALPLAKCVTIDNSMLQFAFCKMSKLLQTLLEKCFQTQIYYK